MKSAWTFGLTVSALCSALAVATLAHSGRYESRPGRAAIAVAAAIALASGFLLWRDRRALAARGRFLVGAWIGTVIAAYSLIAIFLYSQQDRLLFVPVPGRFEACGLLGEEDRAPDFEAVDTRVDGERVRAYVRVPEGARNWVIIFHGNAESACTATYYARELMKAPAPPLAFEVVEYPGYLGDPAPASQAAFEHAAELAYAYAIGRRALPVISFGRSLGTGVATYLASVRPVSGLVLISPYTSIADVGAYQYPFLPVHWLIHNPFPASEWASRVSAPTLVIHGSADRVVPVAFGRAQATRLHARYVEYPGGTHGSVVRPEAPAWGEVRAFIADTLGQ